MDTEKLKKRLKWFWWFIWEDDSIWSWIANVIIAFVLIKFIVYPGLGLLLVTSHPVVAVVSSSMEHDGSFDQWWRSAAICGKEQCTQAEFYSQLNVSKDDFRKFPLKNGFNMGDIIVLKGKKPSEINKGDIIVFKSGRPDPIIHRVINRWQEEGVYHYQTKGDHNKDMIRDITLDESDINQNSVIGRQLFKIPYLGWIKILFVKSLQLLHIV